MVDFETSRSKSEVSKSNLWKITSFSKTMSLQRELFLTMFYSIILSPLLVTKQGFLLIIILSDYQKCPLPLITVYGGNILCFEIHQLDGNRFSFGFFFLLSGFWFFKYLTHCSLVIFVAKNC